jgi:methylmalonyl-CoA mutase C-terminal domain/subunit
MEKQSNLFLYEKLVDKDRPIRILIAKPGLDGHDKGAKVVAKALKDAGMEVIYIGLRQSSDSILSAAVEENVDIIGLSILSGSHVPICRELLEKMGQRDIEGVKVVVGGVIPRADVQVLKDLGISEVFRGGSSFDDIIQAVREIVSGPGRP